ncbi:hypothetical protein [Longitalea luteola]|uniref:hypothetical protein n=1 Tax=Longitalea luteola TaxID=2812563 RepID=UPI001A969CC7|nr:hypothetical protein [Longitalea luteola]
MKEDSLFGISSGFTNERTGISSGYPEEIPNKSWTRMGAEWEKVAIFSASKYQLSNNNLVKFREMNNTTK